MSAAKRQRLADTLAVAGGFGVLVGTAFLILLTLDGGRFFRDSNSGHLRFGHEIDALGWLVAALAGGFALFASWVITRDGAEARTRAERSRLWAEERAAAAERDRDRAIRARHVEREWNRELREKLGELYRERRGLAEMDDVRTLVLHTAVALLDAEKGLLLERSGDGDRLEVCRAEGFDHDPADARVVRRFAGEVLARDKIQREDSLDQDPEATAADREVQNLVAIPLYVADEFGGVVVVANREGGFDEHDDEVLLALGNHASAVLDNSRLQADLRSSYLGSVRMLTEAIEAKDSSLRGHSEDVLGYVMAVAERMELDGEQRENLLFGSLLHDVGKIGISEQILAKPGPLTAEERSVIELHPRIGFRLVAQVPGLRGVGPAVLHHHERWDGGGYPSGLRGEAIPLEGRIVAVADSFDAMTTDRPYRLGMTLAEACAELEACAGTQFDPEVVKLFLDEVRKRPPGNDVGGALATALEDPELAHRFGGEGIAGGAAAILSDPLTLLYGRRWFDAALVAATAAAQVRNVPFTVAVIELAALDELNRIEGLEAGDAALVAVARAAGHAAGRIDGSACRYSGSRLAILTPKSGSSVDAGLILLSDELAVLPGQPRLAATTWRLGEGGRDVLARIRGGLPVTVP